MSSWPSGSRSRPARGLDCLGKMPPSRTASRLAAVAALAALPVLSAACGSSRPSTAPATTTASAPAASSTTNRTSGGVPATPEADRALAAAVNLSSADLPGWTATPNSTTSADKAVQARLAECAGAPDPAATQIVDVGSPTFRSGTGNMSAEVTSSVTMVRSVADGRSDLQAMQSGALPGCIQQVVVPYLRSRLPAGATISHVTVERLGAPAGLTDSFSYRLVVPVSATGQGTVTITSDTTGFLVGRAEVELNDTETGSVPDPTLEHKLVGLLHQRALRAIST